MIELLASHDFSQGQLMVCVARYIPNKGHDTIEMRLNNNAVEYKKILDKSEIENLINFLKKALEESQMTAETNE